MKGKSPNFSGSNSNMTIIFLLIAIVLIIVVVLICLNLNKKSSNSESFENEKKDDKTYEFRTARAGHGMAYGKLVNSGVEKDPSEKQLINDKYCPAKNGKKGFWVCNEVEYEDGRKRSGCGCLYDTKYNDPLNLFYDDKYKEEGDME